MEQREKLIDLRKKNGLSQMELAEKVYVSRQTVSKWETGDAAPTLENLTALSRLYGVPLDYLIFDKERPPELDAEPAPAPQPSNRRWKIIAGVCMGIIVILLAVLISMGMRETSGAPYIPIKNMQENEVSPTSNTGFDFGA